MRKVQIAPGEYYHIFSRGVRKNIIFHDKADYARLLFTILYYQSSERLTSINYHLKQFLKSGDFRVGQRKLREIIKKREVELTCFIFIPNHFHLIVSEKKEGGISRFLQRVSTAYAMYYNKRYGTSGHLFQGPYGAVLIEDNNQLLYTSAYIHLNCREFKKWKGKEIRYPWSSYQDYVEKNRWGDLLSRKIIMDQFKTPKEYGSWTETSGAKSETSKETS